MLLLSLSLSLASLLRATGALVLLYCSKTDPQERIVDCDGSSSFGFAMLFNTNP
jgi:hypothetical protein